MAQEPINIFSRIADPKAVAALLRDRAPKVKFDPTEEDWRRATVVFGTGKSKQTLTLGHDPEYYSEPNWSVQMSGMQGYFSQFPDTPRKQRILLLPSTFRFSLSTEFEPDFDPEGDPRLELLFEVTRLLDGVIFTPSGLRDANGRILFGAGGEDEEDPEAVWPRVYGEVSMTSPAGAAMHESSRPRGEGETPGEEANPPSPERVARRALALVAVTARAILEQDDREAEHVKETYADLLTWVKDVEIDEEFEEQERLTLHQRLGQLPSRSQINSTWRLEGLVILAWALKRFEIPPYDQLVNFNAMWKTLGLLNAEVARELLAKPEIRSMEEIRELRNQLFAIHWRLRNYRITPKRMDFAEFARTCWFGPLEISHLPLIEGELAIQGKRIDRAAKEAVGTAESIAMERHQAVNWLWEGPEVYSEASVAT